VIFLFFSSNSFAQEDTYTSIRKNINPLAYDLDHSLSNTQDSLLLENKFLFKRVRFLNKTTEKVFDFKPAVMSAKIPLNELPLGKYAVMFYQADKIIVFQIDRLLPLDYKLPLNSDVAINVKQDDDLEVDVVSLSISDADLDADMASSDFNNIDLELDIANLSLVTSHADDTQEMFAEKITMTYNISEPDRSKVMTRAEYRSTHLRPNGRPYND